MTPEQIVQTLQKLKGDRGTLDSHLQEINDYVTPNRDDVTREGAEGEKKGVRLYDTTAGTSAELLAAALYTYLSNTATTFFEMTTGDLTLDQEDDVRKFLESSTNTMHAALNGSNFETEIHEYYLDLVTAGTAGMSIEEDDISDIRFASRHVSDFYFEENSKGRIDTIYRVFKWNARQIVQEFGEKFLNDALRKKFEEASPDRFEICHAIYPRDMGKVGKYLAKTSKGFPFASKYVAIQFKHELRESGYQEMPMPISRWTKNSKEKYGRSPSAKALPAIKMINKMQETTLRSAQKALAPPMQMPDDGFLGKVRTGPDAINFYRSGTQERIETFGGEGRVDFGIAAIERIEKQIREHFFVDQLKLREGPQMTAMEVGQRTQEASRLMGPVVGRQHPEFLQPMADRVFAILLRRKKIVIPDSVLQKLSGRNLYVRYSSLIAKAQRLSEGQNISNVLATVGPIAQVQPSVMDNFNLDDTARYIADNFGFPKRLTRDVTDRDKIREDRAAEESAMRKQQQESHEAEVASKVAPAAAQAQEAGLA